MLVIPDISLNDGGINPVSLERIASGVSRLIPFSGGGFALLEPKRLRPPRSPRQRGSNENTNGLLRQYFSKGRDLSIYSRAHLNRIVFFYQ
jgi:hypothetical protein